MKRAHILVSLAVTGLLLVAYSVWGEAIFPKAVTAHLHAGGAVEGVTLDRTVVFKYSEPIMVASAIDGDTIQLINGEYVRYNGIDTPEEFDPRKNVQCYAKEAADRNRALVEGKMVTIYKDVSDKDKYGRWVGFVYLPDGAFVNDVLVKEGYAFAYKYKPDISKADEFKADEDAARAANVGIWAHCTVYQLSSGRKQTNDL